MKIKSFFLALSIFLLSALSQSSFAQEVKPESPLDPRKFKSHESLIEAILLRMDSADVASRLDAGILLRDIARTSDIARLISVLKGGNILDKQLFIIDTLGRLGDPRSGTALRFEIDNGEPLARRAAASALGKLEFDWPVPVLAQVVLKYEGRENVDEKLAMRAAAAIGEIASPRAKDSLKSILSRNSGAPQSVKNTSYWALRKAEGQIPDDATNTEIEIGRQLQLNYKGYEYFFYVPSASASLYDKPWLLVCVHDTDREVKALFDACWQKGKELRMAVLMPYFDVMRFADFGEFNVWGKRPDKYLLKLIEHLGTYAGVNTNEIYMFGAGEGGDFVQKFSLAYPDRIAKAAFASSNYISLDPALLFPVGIAKNPLAEDLKFDLQKFIKSDVAVLFPKQSSINAIHNERYAKDYLDKIKIFAAKNSSRLRTAVRQISSIGNDSQVAMFNSAAEYLFAPN